MSVPRTRRPDPMLGVAALLIGAEASLVYLLSALLAGSPAAAPLPWAGLWGAGVLAFALPRLFDGLPRRLEVVLTVGAVLLTYALAVYASGYADEPFSSWSWARDAARELAFQGGRSARSLHLLALVLLGVWWRSSARETPRLDEAGKLFRAGPIPATTLVIWGLFRWGALGPELRVLAWYTATFFVLCLVALALSQWVETQGRGGRRRGATAGWAAASVAPLVLVIGVTIVVSALLFGRGVPFLDAIQVVFGWIVLLAVTVIRALLLAVAYLIALLLAPFSFLDGLLRPSGRDGQGSPLERLRRGEWDIPEVPPALATALLAVGVIVVLYLITRYRSRRRKPDAVGVERESIWEAPDVLGGLGSLLGRLRDRFRREEDPLRALLADPVWRHTARVRLTYREVQDRYARAGRGRAAHATAGEHAEGQGSPPLEELAALYERARYGTVPASEEHAERAGRLQGELGERGLGQRRWVDTTEPGDPP